MDVLPKKFWTSSCSVSYINVEEVRPSIQVPDATTFFVFIQKYGFDHDCFLSECVSDMDFGPPQV